MSRTEWRRRALTCLTGSLVALSLAAAAPQAATGTAPAGEPAAVESRAEAHGTTITARAEPSRCEVGTPIVLTLTLSRTGGLPTANQLDGAVPETFGAFHAEPIGAPRLEGTSLVARYRLTTFASGTLPIPAIIVGLDGGEASPRAVTLTTRPLSVEVVSVLGEGEEDPTVFRDIKGELDLVPKPTQWAPIAAAIALGTTCFLAILIALTRRRGPKPAPTADAVALSALDALEAEGLPAKQRIHEFHVRLSDIVRHYIEDRFAIRAPERTTPEFLREAKASSVLSETQQATLADLLKAADMVKFAAVRPDPERCVESLASARAFVRETVPQEAPR